MRGRDALALVVLAATVALPARAPAQVLRRLHVDALSMRADRTRLHPGDVFHLAIHAHVRERVGALDELVVPDIGTMQNEGDERHVTHSAGGTDVIETLTLEATTAGRVTFEGAYLDAIDARTGKPSRFRANPVRVAVLPSGPFALQRYGEFFKLLGALLIAVLALVAVVAAIAVSRARRGAVASPAIVAPAAPPSPPPSPRDVARAALRAYLSAPQTSTLMHLRAALFAAAGAGPGATLADALVTTRDGAVRAALVAAERTAFGPPAERDAASAALVGATQEWLR